MNDCFGQTIVTASLKHGLLPLPEVSTRGSRFLATASSLPSNNVIAPWKTNSDNCGTGVMKTPWRKKVDGAPAD
jgi:hypothetical protein